MLVQRNKQFTAIFVTAILLSLALLLHFGMKTANADQAEVAFNKDNLIRLHVVANSDSTTDQQVKLNVRNAVLEASGGLLSNVSDQKKAWEVLQNNLELIRRAAQKRVLAMGEKYPVQIELGEYSFPPKAYGNFVLAAGTYPAVKVTLGKGEGHNWWCVLFPPLCFLNMSGPITSERIQKEPNEEEEAKISLELFNPFGLPNRQVPVVTPGIQGK